MAKKKSDRSPKFTIGSHEDLQSICRTLANESEHDISEESLQRFFHLCKELNVALHPWATIRDLKPSEIDDSTQEHAHHCLVFLWRKEVFERFCSWLSSIEGQPVDVLGSFQSDTFIEYFTDLTINERQGFLNTLGLRLERILFEEYGFALSTKFSWPVLRPELRRLEERREKLKFLTGIAGWERSRYGEAIMPSEQKKMAERLWQELELQGEIGHYPPTDNKSTLVALIPLTEQFEPLRNLLNSLQIEFGKIVWTAQLKELARLIDRLFNTDKEQEALILNLPRRFERATEWFTSKKGPLNAKSLESMASQMRITDAIFSIPKSIEDLCDNIRDNAQ